MRTALIRSLLPPALRRFAALFAAVLACGGMAQAEPSTGPDVEFQRLSVADGLSQSHVLAIRQDAAGRMWFATENGLNAFDGAGFTQYLRERGNPQALASDYIYDIAEGRDGSLWLATNGGGLARLDQASGLFSTLRGADGLSSDILHAVLADASGDIWIGTRGSGVDRYDPATGRLTNYRLGDDDSPGADEVFALWEGSDGDIWAGTNDGLYRLDPASAAGERVVPSGPRGAVRVRSLLGDGSGRLWVGTDGAGLLRLDPVTGELRAFEYDRADPLSLPDDRVLALFEDGKRRLWVGTAGGLALYHSSRDGFTTYRHDPSEPTSLGDDVVTSIYQDTHGVLWVGTQNQGLNRMVVRSGDLGGQDARHLSRSGEEKPNVTSFLEVDGVLWLGTFGDGLVATDRSTGSVVRYQHDPADPGSIADDRVMSLLRDSAGRIWIGTMKGGVSLLDPATGGVEHLRHDPEDPGSLGANGIMSLYEDTRGLVWVGTFGGGISLYHPGTRRFTRFQAGDGDAALGSNRVTAFAETSAGDMWIGTDAGGLNFYDRETGAFRRFRHDPADAGSLASDTVYSLAVDAGGVLWIGTNGGGLDRLVGHPDDPASVSFVNLSRTDGLANDVVYGVQIDQAGRLWLSTNQGISRYDPYAGMITNLGLDDGLQSIEFNFGAHYRSDSGELFFGGPNGFNAFRPEATGTDGLLAPMGCLRQPGPQRPGPVTCADDSSLVLLFHPRMYFAEDVS